MDQEESGAPLSESERQKIDEAFSRLGEQDYYEILGVSRDEDRGQIKKAYYQTSKVFHPDRFFRRPLGTYKEKLEILFDVITKAYNTLSDPDLRVEYDREHPQVLKPTRPAPGAGSGRPSTEARASGDRPGVAPGQSRVDSGGARPAAARRVPRPDRMPPPKPIFQSALAKQLIERRRKAHMYFKQGKELYEAGDHQKALSSLQLALSFDPANAEAKRLMDSAHAQVADVRAETHYQRGLQQEMVGSTDVARRFFQMAVDCRPKKGYYYFKMAQIMSGESESRQRLEQLKLAHQYEPDNLEYLLALADCYDVAGMPRNALREYEKVLKLHKGHDVADKAVRRLKAAI